MSGGDGRPPPLADGAPITGNWTNATGNLAGLPSECGNVADLQAKPDEDLLIAGIAALGLWGSRNGGNTWQPLGGDAGPTAISNRPQILVFDPQSPMRFWEAGIYGSGVYETTDDGNTFTQLGSVMHCDSVSVDLSDPARSTLLAGGHEQSQTLYRSADGGKTWNNVGAGLPAMTNCTQPLVIDAKNYLVGCGGYGGGPTGIYRSTDSGATWGLATKSGGGNHPLRSADGKTIYWASPNGAGMTKSPDNGQTWVDLVGGGVISGLSPVELPDKRIATLGSQSEVLVSADGLTWTPVTPTLPFTNPVGLAYSAQQKAFFAWYLTCGFNGAVPVPPDAIARFDFDYQQK